MTQSLSTLLARLREALSRIRLELSLPQADQTKQWVGQAVAQLDDYILPRLHSIEAPLLAVVGGSTGAGKSTLVNSLIRQVVTVPGVIRPTTKAPVLIHHPDDAAWFATDRILPGLARSAFATANPRSLQIVASSALPQGLAILDAPDIDSVDIDNRNLASQLLSAADLWLFVTSAARYADAVPWTYLAQAASRQAAVAVVVDRVPAAALSAVPEHLATMMAERGLGDAPLFAVPEVETNAAGLLPASAVQPIRTWLEYLASNQITRAKVVMATLDGAILALEPGVRQLAEQLSVQDEAVKDLRRDVMSTFVDVKAATKTHSVDGSLLRGEVMSRWQDFVGTGEFMRSVESRIGRARDRVTRFVSGAPEKTVEVEVAVKSSLESLVLEAGQSARQRVEVAWSTSAAGRQLIEWSGVKVGELSAEYPGQVEMAIRYWQDDILAVVEQEGASRRAKARLAALGVNATGVCLMLVAFAHTAGVTGAEIGIAGGTAVVAQKVLELVFGDESIRRLSAIAGKKLSQRINQVLDDERGRLLASTLDRLPVDNVTGESLTQLAAEVDQARQLEMRRIEGLDENILGAELEDGALDG